MTWKEFKSSLEKEGVKDDTEILSIDVADSDTAESLNLTFSDGDKFVEVW